MGSCIICGTSVEGHICDIHEEDAVFEFRGSTPEQLTPGRYYRGTVDGFAEFGVFVDIGDSVTGLLHQSELDSRLESLDWQPGDTVYVRVTNVRDNGNVDLSWSIRQADEEFRGVLIDDPDEDHELLPEETDEPIEEESTPEDSAESTETESTESKPAEATAAGAVRTRDEAQTGGGTVGAEESEPEPATETSITNESAEVEETADTADTESEVTETERTPEPPSVDVGDLDGWVGDTVRITGEIVDARQTSGPTVFELRDGTGSVDCAAFVEAGVRAYPSVEEGAVVEIDGEVRERRGELQVETEELELFDEDKREAVLEEIEATLSERARPDEIDPLVDDEAVAAESESIRDVVGEIRRAVLEDRPVIVRHSATTDGYVGGAAIERAVLPLVRDRHDRRDAEYHYIDRRPLEGDVYGLDDATTDVTRMLGDRERHDENLPLLVFVAVGGTEESLDGFDLLDVYDAQRVVIDTVAEPAIVEAVDAALAPQADATSIAVADGTTRGPTASALAATVGAHVEEDVRPDLAHLPAVSYWGEVPDAYAEAAAEAGYDGTAVSEIREAVALEAYYQSYEDKRELVTDLLFGGRETTDADVRGLASHVSEQFREKLDVAVETAQENLDRRSVGDETIGVLDIDRFTHTYDFPPATLLLDELYRRCDDLTAIVGVDEDELHVRSGHELDVRQLVEMADETVEGADLEPLSTRSHRIEFLAGQRSTVVDAVLDAIVDSI
ncbi:Archaea-specific RecJ-like exonuclease, containsDnaJ-type Zn finger domain [Halorhabdus sp. SVX81]|uniref:OB-fold nucleic acid binding domain-containing protein n=1 Tax=Halorhabdus sp. SVX81 TaxID=2978283 RepID=UPI0023DA8A9B|nr:OB-fold nucleic acid binding domain-containing protein [Halorhabdus sp. SVX81]WEL17817.1 Archaea-specific RecJ-like exonuclease, containsDnaJ-type Zn finger domain [Halorhabdus sp. SVX81]